MNHRLLVAYYVATLVFLLLDVALGINLRVAFLDDYPGWRAGYYALCGVCLLLVIKKPGWEAVVSGVESLFTLVALILSLALRSMFLGDLAGGGEFRPVTVEEVVNFLISGSVAYFAWHRGLKALGGSS